jgi:hypothetical protein
MKKFKFLLNKISLSEIIYPALLLTVLCIISSCREKEMTSSSKADAYVVVAKDDSAYFELDDHSPYIPIGLNLIHPNSADEGKAQKSMVEYESWMKALSENGGNYIRVWLSYPFWDIESVKAGQYEEAKLQRIRHLLALAKKYNLRVKLTLEHFRAISKEESSQTWATKFIYQKLNGGPLDSVEQYVTDPAGQALFLNKLDFYKKNIGDDPVIFGWELWNEMNAMSIPVDSAFIAWNRKMLGEVKQRFPKNLVMQSLGSFDTKSVTEVYKKMMLMDGNEVAQIHRYLDLGAELEICHGPMDEIGADAVKELLSYHTGKPSILAETGAVEPQHAGPFKYYVVDTIGMILHDALFAPFFSGSAGAGMIWHWNQYVGPNKLWHHFDRFAQVVKDLDPVAEHLRPFYFETGQLKIFGLRGYKIFLLWCRDKNNTWETELKNGTMPQEIKNVVVRLDSIERHGKFKFIRSFDPWENHWSDILFDSVSITLPSFKRSLVIKGEINPSE